LIITPNPVDELLKISSNGIIAYKRLIIYDLSDKVINMPILRDVKKLEINASLLAEGSYLVKPEGASEMRFLKFLTN
jgi:hypothetical protein